MSTRSARALGALAAMAALGAAAVPRAAAAEPARPPVVMIVLDEFPVDTMLRSDGRIDSRRFPGFADLARHTTWFPNAHTVYDSTDQAVPALLVGDLPNRQLPRTHRAYPRNLFTYLGRLGYRMRVREEATTLCPPRLCRRTRNYGSPRPNILYGRRDRLERTIRGIRREHRPSLTFHHIPLPHGPWSYLPSGKGRTGVPPGTLPDFAGPPGFGNPFLTLHNQQRYLLQLGFLDREIGRLMRRMRSRGVLRRSLLVVVADHGISFELDVDDRRQVTGSNIAEIAPVPLFVKAPGQRRGWVNNAYARTIDVLPTIADLLGKPLGRRTDGSSVFGAAVRRRSGVLMEARDFSRVLRVPAEEMERRRRALILRRESLFGTGSWAGVFRLGPNPDLLGASPSLMGQAQTPAHARFALPNGLSSFDPKGTTAPTWVAGRIRGGARGEERDLAVSVNGRIRAVGRSFHLETSAIEWFSLTFPESALRRRDNEVRLYEVRAAGEDDDALALLGERR